MDKKEFMWHAKRGYGICIFLIKKDKNKYFNCVKKIILNNYAFLNDNEYRSSYAYELASYYDNKFDFVNLIIKKLFRLRLSDDYTICYLLNNLFFFSMTDKHKKRIVKWLKKWINKINYSKKETKSLKSLFELIVDKDIFIDECKKILNEYLLMFPKSNINIDIKGLRPKNYITLKNDKIISLDEININIINKIVDDDYFKKIYPLFSIYATNELIEQLIDEFDNIILDKDTKKKILILISSMNNLRIKYIKFLHNNLFKIDKETDLEILYCISNQKKKNIKKLFSNLKNTTYEPLLIPIILNNYEESDYKTINKLLKKIKINYSDASYWFECENALIKYFNKKIIDKRLLKNIYNFFRNGLCSTSRYNLIKILLKYNKLSDEEIYYCRYDSDYNTRKLIKKY